MVGHGNRKKLYFPMCSLCALAGGRRHIPLQGPDAFMGRPVDLSPPGMVSEDLFGAEEAPQAVRNAASLLPLPPTYAVLPGGREQQGAADGHSDFSVAQLKPRSENPFSLSHSYSPTTLVPLSHGYYLMMPSFERLCKG